MGISTNEFREHVSEIIKNMERNYIDITSGDIHLEMGGYPQPNPRMPSCCNAMRQLMLEGDIIISEPPKGNGATLTIRYIKR